MNATRKHLLEASRAIGEALDHIYSSGDPRSSEIAEQLAELAHRVRDRADEHIRLQPTDEEGMRL